LNTKNSQTRRGSTGFATAFDLTQVMSDRVFVRGFDYGTGEDAIKAHFLQAETK